MQMTPAYISYCTTIDSKQGRSYRQTLRFLAFAAIRLAGPGRTYTPGALSGERNLIESKKSFREKLGLRRQSGGGWFAARHADDAEHGDFTERAAWHENTHSSAVQIRRRDLNAGIEQSEQIVADRAFEGFVIAKLQPHPQAIEFRPAEERFTFGLVIVCEIAHEIDGANLFQRDFAMLAVGCEHVERVVGKPQRIHIALQRGAVGESDDHLFVRGGCGARFHS